MENLNILKIIETAFNEHVSAEGWSDDRGVNMATIIGRNDFLKEAKQKLADAFISEFGFNLVNNALPKDTKTVRCFDGLTVREGFYSNKNSLWVIGNHGLEDGVIIAWSDYETKTTVMPTAIEYGDYVQFNDELGSVYLWSKDIEKINGGRWMPSKISKEEYDMAINKKLKK